MYQLIGIINDEKVGGLESLFNYTNENSFSKDDPAMNEHRYHIIKAQYNEDTHNIYNIYKPKHIILNMIDVQLNTITIKHRMQIIVIIILQIP